MPFIIMSSVWPITMVNGLFNSCAHTGDNLSHQRHFFRLQQPVIRRLQANFHVFQRLRKYADFVRTVCRETAFHIAGANAAGFLRSAAPRAW